jgi:hypothetical protein
MITCSLPDIKNELKNIRHEISTHEQAIRALKFRAVQLRKIRNVIEENSL